MAATQRAAAQTHTAVLGALSIAPMTGYALREQIRDTLGHFWSESFGQIYPALAELEQQGLVERRETGTRRSAIFAPTADGITRLRELLAEPPRPSSPRNGVMLRLFFGRQLGVDACRDLITQTRDRAEAQLVEFELARRELATDDDLRADAPFILLTVSAGEHGARAAIAWANDALASLSTAESTTSPLSKEHT